VVSPQSQGRAPAGADQSVASRLSSRTDGAFIEEERRGLMLAATVRMAGVAVLVFWQAIDSPDSGWAYAARIAEIGMFGLLGLLQYLSARFRIYPNALKYIFVLVDCALLVFVLSIQDPFDDTVIPPAILMDSSQAIYFFMFLTQAAFSFRPHLVYWCGVCIVTARTGMLVWFASQPGVYTNLDLAELSTAALIDARADPNFLFLGFWATEMIVTLIVTAGLATLVGRSKRLVESRSLAERTRASLARYFSPNVVDHLSDSGDLLHEGREQDVAVLFADIISFTKLCEEQSARNVVALLREYHNRLGQAVFDNGGTLDKYIGDGLMATFGTPQPGPDDARGALRCAFDMMAALEKWNEERAAIDAEPIQVGIGLHFGPAIAGDIGNDRRLEYSVIGDTVNIASRLEHLTRELDTPLVVSDRLIQAIGTAGKRDGDLLSNLRDCGVQTVRGREAGVAVWIYDTG